MNNGIICFSTSLVSENSQGTGSSDTNCLTTGTVKVCDEVNTSQHTHNHTVVQNESRSVLECNHTIISVWSPMLCVFILYTLTVDHVLYWCRCSALRSPHSCFVLYIKTVDKCSWCKSNMSALKVRAFGCPVISLLTCTVWCSSPVVVCYCVAVMFFRLLNKT